MTVVKEVSIGHKMNTRKMFKNTKFCKAENKYTENDDVKHVKNRKIDRSVIDDIASQSVSRDDDEINHLFGSDICEWKRKIAQLGIGI